MDLLHLSSRACEPWSPQNGDGVEMVTRQVVDSLIDQQLHGTANLGGSRSSGIVQEVMEEHSVFPFVPGTFPQARWAVSSQYQYQSFLAACARQVPFCCNTDHFSPA